MSLAKTSKNEQSPLDLTSTMKSADEKLQPEKDEPLVVVHKPKVIKPMSAAGKRARLLVIEG